jgi:hypothetical protein
MVLNCTMGSISEFKSDLIFVKAILICYFSQYIQTVNISNDSC